VKAEPHAIRLTVQGEGGKSVHVMWRPDERLHQVLSRAAQSLYRGHKTVVYVRSIYQVRRREVDCRELEYEVRQREPLATLGTVRCTLIKQNGSLERWWSEIVE
jgi:hypothetical protein